MMQRRFISRQLYYFFLSNKLTSMVTPVHDLIPHPFDITARADFDLVVTGIQPIGLGRSPSRQFDFFDRRKPTKKVYAKIYNPLHARRNKSQFFDKPFLMLLKSRRYTYKVKPAKRPSRGKIRNLELRRKVYIKSKVFFNPTTCVLANKYVSSRASCLETSVDIGSLLESFYSRRWEFPHFAYRGLGDVVTSQSSITPKPLILGTSTSLVTKIINLKTICLTAAANAAISLSAISKKKTPLFTQPSLPLSFSVAAIFLTVTPHFFRFRKRFLRMFMFSKKSSGIVNRRIFFKKRKFSSRLKKKIKLKIKIKLKTKKKAFAFVSIFKKKTIKKKKLYNIKKKRSTRRRRKGRTTLLSYLYMSKFFSKFASSVAARPVVYFNNNYAMRLQLSYLKQLGQGLLRSFSFLKKTRVAARLVGLLLSSIKFKDPFIVTAEIKRMFEEVHFKKHKMYFSMWRSLIISFLRRHLAKSNALGLKLEFHGKLGIGGNAKKRTFIYSVGMNSNSSKILKTVYSHDVIRTATGVVGFTY